jgi:predicted MPP superfamily phosphohydrolase
MLFVLVVCGVYLGMNWYVLARLARLFALRPGGWLYVALVPLTLSLVVALAVESRYGGFLASAFFTLAVTWLGLCWLLLCILLAQQLLALVIPAPQRVWAIGVCGLACGLALYALVNARAVTVRRERIPRLPLRVVQLSDIHIGSVGPAMLAEIVAKTNALKPDIILITGDLFDNANAETRTVTGQLKGFAAPALFTSGNHEAYTGYDNVREMLAGTGIRWLRNETVEVRGIRIIGVDNSYGTELLQSVLDRTPSSPAFTILMNHQPTGFDIAARRGVGLTLSGHVHDGQIWPFNYVVGLFYPYLKGLHENGGAFLNVSTGTGIWGPPMRLGSRTEIVLLEPGP